MFEKITQVISLLCCCIINVVSFDYYFRNRLTMPACTDHKWFSLASGPTKHRENAIFLTEKLRRFAYDFRQRCRAQTEIQQDTIVEVSKR